MASRSEMAERRNKLVAYRNIPYSLINEEVDGTATHLTEEFGEIMDAYNVYRFGAKFSVEGTSGDYQASNLRHKLAASLVDKEARFMFAETPDVLINPVGDKDKQSEETKAGVALLQMMVEKILEENMFDDILIKSVKDCFIGKRTAGVVNFNEETGVSVEFLPSMNFIYEYEMGTKKLKKFVAFVVVKDRLDSREKRILKKKYEMAEATVDGKSKKYCHIEEILYDGAGKKVEDVTEYQPTLLDEIPVAIFINDGLTNDSKGVSEISYVEDYESYFSKLSNADFDSQRKSMHPIRYVQDMSNKSTKNLSAKPGSLWDLKTDQNTDKTVSGKVGLIEPSMNYSAALEKTLTRTKTAAYEQVDVPNVSVETLQGVVSSGKALGAIYWPLIVRCKEKMKMWGPQLQFMIKMIIAGARVYPNTVERYLGGESVPSVEYDIQIVPNSPLPDDEDEERRRDLEEVAAGTMSRAAYMKKWRLLTDSEVEAELKQMFMEKQLLEDGIDSYMDNEQMQLVNGGQSGEEKVEGSEGGTVGEL